MQNGEITLSMISGSSALPDEKFEKALYRFGPYAGQQHQHPVPGELIGRVCHDAQIGNHVADMGRLVEFPSAEESET